MSEFPESGASRRDVLKSGAFGMGALATVTGERPLSTRAASRFRIRARRPVQSAVGPVGDPERACSGVWGNWQPN